MNKLILIIVCLLSVALHAQEDKIKGTWFNEDKTGKIEVYKATNGKYYGKIVWLSEPDQKDIHNPDPAKRNKNVVGILVLRNFTYNSGEKKWEGGSAYDPENGKSYDSYMWFENDLNKLNLRGYVMGMKWAGRTTVWTRAKM
ncbi:MAG: DUF2147 domain-containing protein [Bacteroidales bacterium]|nr:DUF2147 domain-containing protein [Bacteroidales bacterium]